MCVCEGGGGCVVKSHETTDPTLSLPCVVIYKSIFGIDHLGLRTNKLNNVFSLSNRQHGQVSKAAVVIDMLVIDIL